MAKSQFQSHQKQLTNFWEEFHHKAPGKVTTILPRALYKSLIRSHHSISDPVVRNAAASYEVAAEACKAKVASIVKHCEMTNQKFVDHDFDLSGDPYNCLYDMSGDPRDDSDSDSDDERGGNEHTKDVSRNKMPAERNGFCAGDTIAYESVHRVDWIFEKPRFTIDGYSACDIRQGQLGDCWWLAAVATIAHREDLMDKVMVARNEECGVYGFVFHRDGEWVYTVIDDNLFLASSDFTSGGDCYDPTGKLAREHKKSNQTGSRALALASCEEENETWLPLLEKAYAKVHNDFVSLSGGWPGEGVEDMTGGVNSYIDTSRILSRERMWKDLLNENDEFVFSLALSSTGWEESRGGMATGHAYSLLKAIETVGPKGEKVRLVKVRNPWGSRDTSGFGEWNGRWSDGSSEWTPYWLEKLDHKFGDDGVFWMTYEDMLSHYQEVNRTRLFNKEWTVAQQWTSVNASWASGYLQKKFVVDVKNDSLCVIVLSQLDERYWTNLEGQYMFALYFLLVKEGGKEEDIISKANCNSGSGSRSISCEVNLKAGRYDVIPRVVATKRSRGRDVMDVVTKMVEKNPKKLQQVAMQYDIAHSRPGVMDEDEIMEIKKANMNKKEEAEIVKGKELKKKENIKKVKDEAKRVKEKAKEKERIKRRIERANAGKAKRRIKLQKKVDAKAKAKAKKEAKEAAREAKEAAREAKEASETTKAKKEQVDVKKEDVEEEAKTQTEKPSAIANGKLASAVEETKSGANVPTTVEKCKAGAENQAPGEDQNVEFDEKTGYDDALENKHEDEESESSSDEESESDESSDGDTDPEISSDEEYLTDDESDHDSESESESESECGNEIAPSGWNPVVVLGLRCFTKDKDVMVTVVEPKPSAAGAAVSL